MKLIELFAELDACRTAVPLDILTDRLQRLDLSGGELSRHIRFGDECYRRNLVHLGPSYAALVLCWRPGQASPIHDHRGSACALRVIEGEATETKYDRRPDGALVETANSVYRKGQVCGTFDADIHTMQNDRPGGLDLVTLHVYTPPMRTYHAYSLDDTEVRECRDQEVLAEEQRRRQRDPARPAELAGSRPGAEL